MSLFCAGRRSGQFPAAANLAANFFSEGRDSADSAQKQQICTRRQGTAQGIQGIYQITTSESDT